MRVYFLSYKAAILKLNGLYVGGIDLFERHIEIDLADSVLAEIVPGENLQPVNFFINDKLLSHPPEFMDVYLMGGEALIYIRAYGNKDAGLKIIAQTRFYGNFVTLFSQGGIYLSVEGEEYTLLPLPASFAGAKLEEKAIANLPVLEIKSGNALLILSDRGKRIFMNRVLKAEYKETLEIEAEFETCTAAKAVCSYSYDGEKLTLVSSETVETRPPERGILHFAFFECVLTCGNFAEYLDESLKDKASSLKSYLGEFVSVTVPTEKFYAEHPAEQSAGLVYPKGSNLFEVKYFATEISKAGKITNIYPVEN
ncbi:MAG: hypothetical protein J1G07_06635 [Clostridiales bacterium]|nr:hypothetical protein [Clostridiales bacterium]